MSDQQQIETAVNQNKGRKRLLPKLGCIVLMTILLGLFKTRIPGANVAMVDASCRFFTADMSPEELLEKSRIREVNKEAESINAVD